MGFVILHRWVLFLIKGKDNGAEGCFISYGDANDCWYVAYSLIHESMKEFLSCAVQTKWVQYDFSLFFNQIALKYTIYTKGNRSLSYVFSADGRVNLLNTKKWIKNSIACSINLLDCIANIDNFILCKLKSHIKS